jgi:histidinol-phosphatase
MTAIAAMTEADDLAFARLFADAADRISLDLYRDAELLMVAKPDRTEVSEADRAVEAALRRLLRTHRPEQGVLGGERGTVGNWRVRWLLDPVDATSNFVQGVDWWATLLALEIDGRVEVAMISAPAMGRRWWATRGQGAWTTGPLDPSPPGHWPSRGSMTWPARWLTATCASIPGLPILPAAAGVPAGSATS